MQANGSVDGESIKGPGFCMDFYTPLLILSWYSSNIGVLLLNKYLLSYFGFKYPVFLTLCHMLACTVLGLALSRLGVVTTKSVHGRATLVKIAILATVFCVSVVLGNVSLRFIPVSFTQAIGATTPLFTAILGLIILQERESALVYASLIPVVVGIVMASGGEPLFNLLGFLAAITATAARAFKSVLQSVLMSGSTERLDSLSLLSYMAPLAAAMLLPATLILEGNVPAQAAALAADHIWFLPALGLNSFLAFFVNLTNFLVTKHTSALTLQVLGNAKGVVAATTSVMLFRNPVTGMGVAGYSITVAGVVAYSQAKRRAKGMAKGGRAAEPLLPKTSAPLPIPDSPRIKIVPSSPRATGLSPRRTRPQA